MFRSKEEYEFKLCYLRTSDGRVPYERIGESKPLRWKRPDKFLTHYFPLECGDLVDFDVTKMDRCTECTCKYCVKGILKDGQPCRTCKMTGKKQTMVRKGQRVRRTPKSAHGHNCSVCKDTEYIDGEETWAHGRIEGFNEKTSRYTVKIMDRTNKAGQVTLSAVNVIARLQDAIIGGEMVNVSPSGVRNITYE